MKALQVVGGVTCQVITCPVCGTRLRICSQALAPEYLIENAQCPVCGTVVAHWVLSIAVTTEVAQIDMSEIINLVMIIMVMGMMMSMMRGMFAQTAD